jgi:hypothetical protein
VDYLKVCTFVGFKDFFKWCEQMTMEGDSYELQASGKWYADLKVIFMQRPRDAAKTRKTS